MFKFNFAENKNFFQSINWSHYVSRVGTKCNFLWWIKWVICTKFQKFVSNGIRFFADCYFSIILNFCWRRYQNATDKYGPRRYAIIYGGGIIIWCTETIWYMVLVKQHIDRLQMIPFYIFSLEEKLCIICYPKYVAPRKAIYVLRIPGFRRI